MDVRLCLGLCLLAPLLSARAAAPDQRIAMHPLVVLESDGPGRARLQRVFEEELAARNVERVQPACVESFLAKLPRTSCAADDECLARLARTCDARRAVYVAAVPYPGKVVLSGKVVRVSGMTERTVSGVEVPRRPGVAGEVALREGIRTFLADELKVDTFDLHPLVEAPSAPAAPAEPATQVAAAPPPPPAKLTGTQVAGIAVGGTAVAAAIAGGGVWLASLAPRRELAGLLTPSGSVPPGNARAVQLDQRLNAQGKWTAGLLIGAGALAVTSVVLVLVGREPAPAAPRIAVGATDREVGVLVSGRF